MLNTTTRRDAVHARRPALAVVATALAPTTRTARPGPVLLTVVLGASPALVTMARGQAVHGAAVIIASLVAGATAGWAVEDPVAELFAPLPVASSTRLMMRLSIIATVTTVPSVMLLLALIIGPGVPPDLQDRGPEAAAAATVALSVGLIAVRRGERSYGPVAVTAGTLGVVVIGGLAIRWPTVFPPLGHSPVHARWWLIVIAALVVAVRNGRDVSRR